MTVTDYAGIMNDPKLKGHRSQAQTYLKSAHDESLLHEIFRDNSDFLRSAAVFYECAARSFLSARMPRQAWGSFDRASKAYNKLACRLNIYSEIPDSDNEDLREARKSFKRTHKRAEMMNKVLKGDWRGFKGPKMEDKK